MVDNSNPVTATNYLVIQLINAILGPAKDKLSENSSSLFRILFGYKNNDSEENQIKIKSTKRDLKEGIMDFNQELILFKNTDRINGIWEIRMMIANSDRSCRFKKYAIYLNKLKYMEEEILTVKMPAASKLTIKYKITNSVEGVKRFCKNNNLTSSMFFNDNPQKFEFSDSIEQTKTLVSDKDCDAGVIKQPINKEIISINLNCWTDVKPDWETPKENTEEKIENIFNDNEIWEGEGNNSSSFHAIRHMFEMKSATENKAPVIASKHKNDIKSSISSHNLNKAATINSLKNSNFCNQPKNIIIQPRETVFTEEENETSAFSQFCDGFFVSSFSATEGKPIENSNNYKSICSHVTCSKILAMEPEIIYRYPLKDSANLELNSLLATMCFPSGIKVCYNQDDREIYDNYFTTITNQEGSKSYLMNYYWYVKYEHIEYNKEYVTNPLRFQIRKFAEQVFKTQEEKEILELEIESYSRWSLENYVYVPFCISLISKFPFLPQMEQCLKSCFYILTDKTVDNQWINKYITYLIRGITIPSQFATITFNIPYSVTPIEIYYPYLITDAITSNKIINKELNLLQLFDIFKVDQIIKIYQLWLFEQKILFIDNNYSRLSSTIESFLSLLYPWEWTNTNIPIMSIQMTKYLQSFIPFINGIHEDLIDDANESLKEAEGVYVININDKTIIKSSPVPSKDAKDPIPRFPTITYKKLLIELDSVKIIKNKTPITDKEGIYNMTSMIRNIFLETFASLFYDFWDYTFTMNDRYVIFNHEMWAGKRAKEDERFFREVCETQIFNNFLQAINKNKNDYILFSKIKEDVKEKILKNDKLINKGIKKYEDVVNFNTPDQTAGEIRTKYRINNPDLEVQSNNNNEIDRKNIEHFNKIDPEKYPESLTGDHKTYCIYPITGQEKCVHKKAISILNKVEIYESKWKIRNVNTNSSSSSGSKNMKKLDKNDNKLTDAEKVEIEDLIGDIVSKIFRSDIINTKDIDESIFKKLYQNFARDYFTKWIYQKGNHNMKILKQSCFDLLGKLAINIWISLCNMNENDKMWETGIHIVKASFFYCREDNENYLLCDELHKKLKGYFWWSKDSFWRKWTSQIWGKNNMGYINTWCEKMLRLRIDKEYILIFWKEEIERYWGKESTNYNNNIMENKINELIKTISLYPYNEELKK